MRSLLTVLMSLALVAAATTMPRGQATDADTDALLQAVDLPVSLERIKRQLDRLPVAKNEQDVLRLSFYVRVYGQAPAVNVFEGFDVHNGPVPYASPTHATMRDITTPVEFSAPAVNLGNVLGWAWRRRP
jgi:hypothetical protein